MTHPRPRIDRRVAPDGVPEFAGVGLGALVPGRLVILLVAAGLVRLVGLAGPGHEGDVRAFIDWAEGTAKYGLGGYYANGGTSNYPPMLYLLWPLGMALDGGPLITAIRALSIPFDLALGALLYHVARSISGGHREGLLAASFYLLNPAVILVGPMWGQVDGMGALPMVGSIVAVARGRVALAGALAVMAGLVKPQFGIAAFVLLGMGVAWLPAWEGVRRIAILGLASLATWVAVLVPLGLGPLSYLDLMGDTFTQYPYISQFGFNPWGMAFGFGGDDSAWFRVGTALAVGGIAASLWLLRYRRDLVGLLAASVLIGLVIYYLPTRVHERYLYGAVAFLAPLAAVDRRLRPPFVTLSLVFFATLAYVLANSPYRILPGPRLEAFPDWAISVMSLAMTVAGLWTAWRVVRLFAEAPPKSIAPATDPESSAAPGAGSA